MSIYRKQAERQVHEAATPPKRSWLRRFYDRHSFFIWLFVGLYVFFILGVAVSPKQRCETWTVTADNGQKLPIEVCGREGAPLKPRRADEVLLP